jgi:hypothetical protein
MKLDEFMVRLTELADEYYKPENDERCCGINCDDCIADYEGGPCFMNKLQDIVKKYKADKSYTFVVTTSEGTFGCIGYRQPKQNELYLYKDTMIHAYSIPDGARYIMEEI